MKKVLLTVVLMLVARSAAAQDVEAMAKWTAYQIVHYRIVGEYAGEMILMRSPGKKTAIDELTARVTDRIEIEFDWDQQELNVVGKPVIRNFPTKVVSINLEFQLSEFNKIIRSTCPEPKLAGAPEFVTGLGLKVDEVMRVSSGVIVEARRDHPGGSFATSFPYDHPMASQQKAVCGQYWETVKPESETTVLSAMAVPGMYLAMPIPDGQGGMKISADRKSIILAENRPGASGYGWTWTVTPTGVK